MRRKISLYIADRKVDLDDQSFILFNYAMEDLSNPTIVKNSFSQQITLKGTPNNNRIFGDSFRLDRVVSYTGEQGGAAFNAAKKTPFAIYNEMNEILQSGYVKLDSVSRRGADIQYKVTLYGGLGSFFYALSYDENGNKRTLADLIYLDTGNPDSELDFAITAQAVSDAWARLYGDTSKPEMWDVINFAPAYNGIPEGNFDPSKALVDPTSVGLASSVPGEGGVTYTTRGGYCLVNLAEAQDEWAVKDLRSYLQRPVFSIRALLDAVSKPENNGGYEVDLTDLLDFLKVGNYADLWVTLPMLSSLGTFHKSSGDLSLTRTSAWTSGNEIARYDVVGSVPSGSTVTANITCKPLFNMPEGSESYTTLSMEGYKESNVWKSAVIFFQAVAYDSDGNIVGGSAVKVASGLGLTGESLASTCGYTPAWNAGYQNVVNNAFKQSNARIFELLNPNVGFQVEAQNAAYYKILASAYVLQQDGYFVPVTVIGDGMTSVPTGYRSYDIEFMATSVSVVAGDTPDTVTYTSQDNLRSGAVITKAMLLSTEATPADYLLSLCKVFGYYFLYDVETRKVTILRRNDLYQDETIDLTRRIDTSKEISVKPYAFDAKWYDMILEGAGGEFLEEYKKLEGIDYGMQRIDTGYDFDADSVNLMDSVVFKNACTVLERTKYFNYIFKTVGGVQVFQPSPFLDKGNTYTLWSADGETQDTDISCPPDNASVDYYNDNPAYAGYDINKARKLQLHSADGKPVDGSNILVFLEGWDNYLYFKVTDDVPEMDLVNEGVPCWILGAGVSVRIPTFGRYKYGGGQSTIIEDSLDFGYPRQYDIPGIRVEDESRTVYERAWKAYLADRYDVNTKVMTCRVDLTGMKVGQDLLRKFWYYDNALWVLNRITNYSLTTFDTVECEFVQVQDKDNYLNGQDYD